MEIAGVSPSIVDGADHLLARCGCLQPGERVAIVCDPTTRAIGDLLHDRARRMGAKVRLIEIPALRMHGEEPPAETAESMADSDLCLGVTAKSMAHTQARLKAAGRGARYLSLPDYSMELLGDRSLRADYRSRARIARWVADHFTRGRSVRVTTALGTDVTMGIEGRIGNCCPGFVERSGELGSPPDIESNVSPVEDSADGVIIVDGSIPYPTIGLLRSPVVLRVREGRIVNIEGASDIQSKLEALFATVPSNKTRVLAECGVGLNDQATLTGMMLTDEGAAGTMHFGFGSNATVGGKNDVPFHLDFVFRNPTLTVDDETLIRDGQVLYCIS